MTTAISTTTESSVRELSAANGEPEWLLKRRLDAWRTFEAMAMPTGLEEEWRRTDMSGFDLDRALERGKSRKTPARRLPAELTGLAGADGLLLNQDGVISQRFTSPELNPKVVFTDLSEAARENSKLVRENLHSVVMPQEWKLSALQASLWSGGAFIYVPRGVEVKLPLRYATVATSAGVNLFPHLLIVADEGSSVSVIQESLSPDGPAGLGLVSGTVEVIARRDSRVRLFDIERWGKGVYNFSTIRARLETGAQFSAANVGLGGRLTRARIEAILSGDGSRADLVGVSFGNGDQHFDYITLQDHLAARTTSDLLYKAALDGRASEVWYGTCRIHKGATGADANQSSRNLLLSDKAKAAPIPVLEIEQYDILRCSHGATAGPLDEEQGFYLESRGIPKEEAERLLVEAFFKEVLDRVPNESVRLRVEKALLKKLGTVR